MRGSLYVLLGAIATLMACSSNTSSSVFLPKGDVEAGRAVFSQFECYTCHEVKGDSFPAPTVITPTYVALGTGQGARSRGFLVESIIAPSHEFATPRPPNGMTAGDVNIMSGKASRMTNFSDRMTVKQLLDVTTYLESLQGNSRAGSE